MNRIVVNNMPPNTGGKLVQGDVEQLVEITDGLAARRTAVQ